MEIHKVVELILKKEAPIESLPSHLSLYSQFLSGLAGIGLSEHSISLDKAWRVVANDSPDVWLRAILDYKIHLPDQKKVLIYDWKSGKIYDDHDDQKHLYSLTQFAEHADVSEVEFIHTYLDLGQNRSKSYRREWAEAGQQKWNHRVEVMETDDTFIANPTFKCRYCPYRRDIGGPCRF